MNKQALKHLEGFFSDERNTVEAYQSEIKTAALVIATHAAHPNELEAEDLEEIANTISHLSEIIDIIEQYED